MALRYWSISGILRVLGMYLLLVAYSGAYEYFYATQLTALYHDDYTQFAIGKLDTYELICFLTPLAILPMGTWLRSPAQLVIGAAAVFIFIPIPIVFLAMVPVHEFWGIYALLWITYFIASSASSLAVNLKVPQMTDIGYRRFLVIFYLILALGLAYCAATNRFLVVSLDKAHAAQVDVTVKGWQGYVLVGFMGSFGGLLIAFALMFRKFYLLPLALLGYYLCYGTLSERVAVLMPLWIAYMYGMQRWFFKGSAIRYVFTVMLPFAIFLSLVFVLGLEDRTSTFYDIFTLANYRLYAVPAISFNVYYNFFQLNPFTYWSHIGVIANFIHYPYSQPLAAVMMEQYQLGNDNASFIETDGMAAAGPFAMPLAAIVFGLVLVGINTCMQGLNRTLCVIVMAAASVTLIDTGVGPGLVTNGLALMAVVLALAPRYADWNLRYLKS